MTVRNDAHSEMMNVCGYFMSLILSLMKSSKYNEYVNSGYGYLAFRQIGAINISIISRTEFMVDP